MSLRIPFSRRRDQMARRKRTVRKFSPTIQGLEDRKLLSGDPPWADGGSITTVHDQPVPGQLSGYDMDGDAVTFIVVSGPLNGTLDLDTNSGAFTYMPYPGFFGQDSFTFKTNDGTSDSYYLATEIIDVTDEAPNVYDRNVSTHYDQPVPGQLSGYDMDGDAVTFVLVNGPSHGDLLTFDPNSGAFTYMPYPGFFGQDIFTFKANDGLIDSIIATVTVTVAPLDIDVVITGPGGNGLHTGEQGPPPYVTQGMAWSGGVTLGGADADRYEIASYTWAFPAGAMKGYGDFAVNFEAGDQNRQWLAFFTDPDSSSEAEAISTFTVDDLAMNYMEAGDHVINTFYWGPVSVGSSTITTTVTLRNKVTKQMLPDTYGDGVMFNVLRPEGQITLVSQGTAGIATVASGSQWLSSSKDYDGTSSNFDPGISLRGSMSTTGQGTASPIADGVFAFFQLVNSFAYRKWSSGGVQYLEGKPLTSSKTKPGYVVDSAPYDGLLDSPYPAGTPASIAPVVRTFYMEDSPGLEMLNSSIFGHYDAYFRKDMFETYLMYKPNGGIYIPVAVLNWDWQGTSTYDTSKGMYVAAGFSQHSDSSSSATTKFPVWTSNIHDYGWVQYSP